MDTTVKKPVLIIGEEKQIQAGENDFVVVTDEISYTASETNDRIKKSIGKVAEALDKLNGESI
jgi:hypothetical protein